MMSCENAIGCVIGDEIPCARVSEIFYGRGSDFYGRGSGTDTKRDDRGDSFGGGERPHNA